MELNDTPDQAAFRADLRSWLAEHAPKGSPPTDHAELRAYEIAWHRQLHDAGYAALSWPLEYGGRGLGPIEEAILAQETARAGVSQGISYGFIARAMLLFATQEQRQRYLPRLLAADELWCQGFSEPDAGSDLASLRTRATPDPSIGDHGGYRVTGQKTWTSYAEWADFCLCLVRTGDAASRHRGISALIIDMKAPGIEIRPIRTIRGDTEFCEVFFDETPVPAEHLVGELGQGWNYALVTLTYERGPVDVGFVTKHLAALDRLVASAAAREVADPVITKRRLARAAVGIEVLRLQTLRSLSARVDGPPGAEGSIDKLLMAKVEQDLLHTALDITGGATLVGDDEQWFSNYLYSRASTIYGGTAQIQRNVLAERCLGLPR